MAQPNVADAARRAGVQVTVLADELGISRTSIYDISKPDKPTSAALLNRICSRLGCSPEDVVPLPKLASIIMGHDFDRQGAAVGLSAFHRASRRGYDQMTAGLISTLCWGYWRLNPSPNDDSLRRLLDKAKITHALSDQDDEAVRELILEVLTDPAFAAIPHDTVPGGGLKKVFLISPVRADDDDAKALAILYVKDLEAAGVQVHHPQRDTFQDEPHGFGIVCHNIFRIAESDEVHIVWSPQSTGGAADLQVAMALGKPIFVVNNDIEPTPGKSYTNVALLVDSIWREVTNRAGLAPTELARAVIG